MRLSGRQITDTLSEFSFWYFPTSMATHDHWSCMLHVIGTAESMHAGACHAGLDVGFTSSSSSSSSFSSFLSSLAAAAPPPPPPAAAAGAAAAAPPPPPDGTEASLLRPPATTSSMLLPSSSLRSFSTRSESASLPTAQHHNRAELRCRSALIEYYLHDFA